MAVVGLMFALRCNLLNKALNVFNTASWLSNRLNCACVAFKALASSKFPDAPKLSSIESIGITRAFSLITVPNAPSIAFPMAMPGVALAASPALPSQIPDEKQRAKALNAWEYPTQFTRTDPLIDQIGAMFSITPEQIDAMWQQALAS